MKERTKAGWKEGRKEGRKEERKEGGRMERRKQGRNRVTVIQFSPPDWHHQPNVCYQVDQ